MAFHATQLTLTRVLFGGLSWLGTGSSVRFVDHDAVVLVLVHILLGAATFLLLRAKLRRRGGAIAPKQDAAARRASSLRPR